MQLPDLILCSDVVYAWRDEEQFRQLAHTLRALSRPAGATTVLLSIQRRGAPEGEEKEGDLPLEGTAVLRSLSLDELWSLCVPRTEWSSLLQAARFFELALQQGFAVREVRPPFFLF